MKRCGKPRETLQLQATVQDGALTLSSTLGSVHLEPQRWQ
jgi:hypothetical protein